jgi:hypothetical protein
MSEEMTMSKRLFLNYRLFCPRSQVRGYETNNTAVDCGMSGGSSMHRPESEDTQRHQQKCSIIVKLIVAAMFTWTIHFNLNKKFKM